MENRAYIEDEHTVFKFIDPSEKNIFWRISTFILKSMNAAVFFFYPPSEEDIIFPNSKQ